MSPAAASETNDASSDDRAPEGRENILLAGDVETRLAEALRRGELAGGWLIAGGEGIGKATLAFRLARALLEPAALAPTDAAPLQMPRDARAFSLTARGAHPDLFIARRTPDPKTGRLPNEIGVDVVRALIRFMGQTPGVADWRVAIVDTADELNANAANALLKALEEPPARASVILLSAAPGRLLATIRSRCRVVRLAPVEDARVVDFLAREAPDAEEPAALANAARGRPGRALRLASGDGADAAREVRRFLEAARAGAAEGSVARLTKRAADGQWPIFKSLLFERLDDMVREAALAPDGREMATALLDARARAQELLSRGDALNLDRGQLLHATARALRNAGAGG